MNLFVIADIAPDYSEYLFPQVLEWNPWLRISATILLFLLVTLLIEGAIFYAFGFRTKKELARVVVMNVLSIILPLLLIIAVLQEWIFLDEDLMAFCAVGSLLLLEMILARVFFKQTKKWKLLSLVLLANGVAFLPSLWVVDLVF